MGDLACGGVASTHTQERGVRLIRLATGNGVDMSAPCVRESLVVSHAPTYWSVDW